MNCKWRVLFSLPARLLVRVPPQRAFAAHYGKACLVPRPICPTIHTSIIRRDVTYVTEPSGDSRDEWARSQEADMPLAQVIRFDERQAVGRPRRALEKPTMGVILQFPLSPRLAATPTVQAASLDDDRSAGRGRDPG
jgi:hypothetical protein